MADKDHDDGTGDGEDEGADAGAPICAACGVTALPSEAGAGFVCENAGCPAYGEAV